MQTEAHVQDKFISLNGLRYHYREWENEGAPALVLIHGATSSASTWDRVAEAMRDRYRVIAPDLSGHGESEWAAEYSYSRWVEDVAALTEALGLRRFSLLG